MNTTKPISTISYNTPKFLKHKLEYLLECHVISFYMYIQHEGEIDMFGEKEKDHIHLFLIPNERVNTMDLSDEFIETLPNEDKPRKCISWTTSKSDDWILYCLHDKEYLASKFETRQILYTYDDIVASDEDDLRRRFRSAYQSSGYARMRNLYEYANSYGTMSELLKIGAIPINQVSAYTDFFTIVSKNKGMFK